MPMSRGVQEQNLLQMASAEAVPAAGDNRLSSQPGRITSMEQVNKASAHGDGRLNRCLLFLYFGVGGVLLSFVPAVEGYFGLALGILAISVILWILSILTILGKDDWLLKRLSFLDKDAQETNIPLS